MKTLLFFGVLSGLILIGLEFYNEYYISIAGLTLYVSVFILCLSLIILPITRFYVKANIQGYHSLVETLNNVNTDELEDVEKALIRENVIQVNTGLNRVKYFNNTIFDWFIPDEVLDLEPIKMN